MGYPKKVGKNNKKKKFVIVGCPKCLERYPAKIACSLCAPPSYSYRHYPDPTPLEIAYITERIRGGWSAEETALRAAGGSNVVQHRGRKAVLIS